MIGAGDRGELNVILAQIGCDIIALALAASLRQRVVLASAGVDLARAALDRLTARLLRLPMRTSRRASPPRCSAGSWAELTTASTADLICVIDQGRIVERGTHVQLLSRGGLYAHLWAMQTGTARQE